MSETLYRSVKGNVDFGDFVSAVEPVGEFLLHRWCKTHGDWVGHMIPMDGRHCRWALKVDGAKRCTVVDRWMESV